jgi:CDP-diacylglycerol--serine O-phosphatidyltransferase
MKKHIPNFITCLNLFSGSMAVYFGFQGEYDLVLILLLIAAVFDFADGLAARVLKAYSPMGKELDSLADVISFGLAPGVLVFSILSSSSLPFWLAFSGFIVPVFSALRLAKFNIDERQSDSFIGLPTPANALFWSGISFSFTEYMIEYPLITLGLAIVFSVLLVAEIPMFSLKFKNVKWKNNQIQYIFLLVSIVLIVVLGTKSLGLIIAWYIVFSVILNFLKKNKPSNVTN